MSLQDLTPDTVKHLNEQIKEFKYGYSEKANAPRPIDGERLTSGDKLVQSGKFNHIHMYNQGVIQDFLTGGNSWAEGVGAGETLTMVHVYVTARPYSITTLC